MKPDVENVGSTGEEHTRPPGFRRLRLRFVDCSRSESDRNLLVNGLDLMVGNRMCAFLYRRCHGGDLFWREALASVDASAGVAERYEVLVRSPNSPERSPIS